MWSKLCKEVADATLERAEKKASTSFVAAWTIAAFESFAFVNNTSDNCEGQLRADKVGLLSGEDSRLDGVLCEFSCEGVRVTADGASEVTSWEYIVQVYRYGVVWEEMLRGDP